MYQGGRQRYRDGKPTGEYTRYEYEYSKSRGKKHVSGAKSIDLQRSAKIISRNQVFRMEDIPPSPWVMFIQDYVVSHNEENPEYPINFATALRNPEILHDVQEQYYAAQRNPGWIKAVEFLKKKQQQALERYDRTARGSKPKFSHIRGKAKELKQKYPKVFKPYIPVKPILKKEPEEDYEISDDEEYAQELEPQIEDEYHDETTEHIDRTRGEPEYHEHPEYVDERTNVLRHDRPGPYKGSSLSRKSYGHYRSQNDEEEDRYSGYGEELSVPEEQEEEYEYEGSIPINAPRDSTPYEFYDESSGGSSGRRRHRRH